MTNLSFSAAQGTEELYSPTTEEFAKTVKAYQAGDKAASLQLYHWFKRLIKSIAYQESFYSTLQEDCENIAWVIFYETVTDYDKDNFTGFPNYIKKTVTWRMQDAFLSRSYYDPHIDKDAELSDPTPAHLDNYWEGIINDICLKQCIKALKPIEQQVIKLYFFYDYSRAETAAILKIKLTSVKHYLKTAKKKIKAMYLEMNDYVVPKY